MFPSKRKHEKKFQKKIQNSFFEHFLPPQICALSKYGQFTSFFVHNRKKILKFFPQNLYLEFSWIYQRIAPWKFCDHHITISCQYRLIFSKKNIFQNWIFKKMLKICNFCHYKALRNPLFFFWNLILDYPNYHRIAPWKLLVS